MPPPAGRKASLFEGRLAYLPAFLAVRRPAVFFGTFWPAALASERPIAIACLRLLTVRPERPLFNVPALRFFIARSTLLEAFLEYLRAMIFLLTRAEPIGMEEDSSAPRALVRSGYASAFSPREMICPTGRAEYFYKRGWTGMVRKPLICPSGRLLDLTPRRKLGRNTTVGRSTCDVVQWVSITPP